MEAFHYSGSKTVLDNEALDIHRSSVLSNILRSDAMLTQWEAYLTSSVDFFLFYLPSLAECFF